MKIRVGQCKLSRFERLNDPDSMKDLNLGV